MEAEAEFYEETKDMGSQKLTGKARVTRPPHNYVAIVKASVVPIQTFLSTSSAISSMREWFCSNREEIAEVLGRQASEQELLHGACEGSYNYMGDDPRYWRWNTVKESGNVDVEEAELIDVCWLEINGKFRTVVLSLNTLYEVSLVASMAESSWGWDVPTKINITLPDASKLERMESLQHMPPGKSTNILMGEFKTSSKNIGEITFCISETTSYWKHGLVIKGVAFRPKNEVGR